MPIPRRQVVLGDVAAIGRVDFFYEEVACVVEVLSRRYHTSKLDRDADGVRFESLSRLGINVLTIWDDELWQKPHHVVQQTRALLQKLGHV